MKKERKYEELWRNHVKKKPRYSRKRNLLEMMQGGEACPMPSDIASSFDSLPPDRLES